MAAGYGLDQLPQGAQALVQAGGLLSNVAGQVKAERQESALKADMPAIIQAAQAGDFNSAFGLLAKHKPEVMTEEVQKAFGLQAKGQVDPSQQIFQTDKGTFIAPTSGPGVGTSKQLSSDGKVRSPRDPGIEEDRRFRRLERFQDKLAKVDDDFALNIQQIQTAKSQAHLALQNDQAALNLGRSVIKAVEGPGARVSNEDFKSAVGSAEIARKVEDTYLKYKEGNLTGTTVKEINQMLDAMEKIYENKAKDQQFNRIEKFYIRSKKGDPEYRIEDAIEDSGYDVEDFQKQLAPKQPKKAKAPQTDAEKIKYVMSLPQNKGKSPAAVKAALKKAGQIK